MSSGEPASVDTREVYKHTPQVNLTSSTGAVVVPPSAAPSAAPIAPSLAPTPNNALVVSHELFYAMEDEDEVDYEDGELDYFVREKPGESDEQFDERVERVLKDRREVVEEMFVGPGVPEKAVVHDRRMERHQMKQDVIPAPRVSSAEHAAASASPTVLHACAYSFPHYEDLSSEL